MGRHPEHPVLSRAELLLSAALDDAQLQSIALLTPLSGPLEQAGDAIASGVLAAYFAEDENRLSVDILDSRRFQRMSDARDQALSQGADVLLGPLGKRQVAELLAAQPQSIPLITLNRPESGEAIAAGTALQLSLAPEDEARQIAQRAYAAGARRALLVRPAGVWGERMEDALLSAWQPVGGQLAARAEYGNPSTHSPVLEAALQLDRSAARSRELSQLFGESVESRGRRRQDLDVIFLLAKSADEARALKPLIDYHYAGDLPVYALSTADDGRAGLAATRDLEGLRLPVMPWRIGAAPPGLVSGGDAFAALHALGVDAYTLARLGHRLGSGQGLRYRGYTGDLGVAADGVLLRALPMAEFDRGELRAR
jgi:outer membrane PBP1 activator LpoA protein